MQYRRKLPKMVSDVLSAISDDSSLFLFNTVAVTTVSTDILISKSRLTTKQYYSRMSSLTKAGLISKRNGQYSLTSFGKVVYEALELIETARQYFWKLKAIDSIESSNHGWTIEERSKIVNSLIVDDDLKGILLGRNKNKESEKEINRPLVAKQQYLDPQQLNAF